MEYSATIIIPNYNKEKLLNRCLKSIITLSRFNDFEVIFVDDCSTDNSVEIINEYVKKYDNIKLIIHETGSGHCSKPRNTAMEVAKGKYFIFMDPDDLIVNDGYSVLLSKMEEYDSDLLIGTRTGVNEYGVKIFVDYIEETPFINENSVAIKQSIFEKRPFLLKTIYSSKLIKDNNLKFNENLVSGEDEIFNMEYLALATKVTKINDIVYQYTVDAENSITTNMSLKIYEQVGLFLNELERVYSKMFSQEVVINKIVSTINHYFITRLVCLKDKEDMIKACDYIYKGCEDFGFDKLRKTTLVGKENLLDAIENRDYNALIVRSLIRYKQRSNKIAKVLFQKNNKLKKQIRSQKIELNKRNRNFITRLLSKYIFR